MKFPLIKDIASTKVISIDISYTISEALALMLESNHRNIVVIDGSLFKIFTVMDVVNVQIKGKSLKEKLLSCDLMEVPTIDSEKNVLDTIEYLNNSIEYICVTNNDGSLFGLVTHSDISANIDPDILMENYRLQDFLKLGERMKWVQKDETLSDLLRFMTNGMYDNLIVVEDAKPVGILTTKDVMRLIKSSSDMHLPISTYMTSPVETVLKTASIKEALDFIKTKHFRRVVVVDEEDKLIGIIAQKELISLTYSKWVVLMKEHQEELNEINHMLEAKYKEYEQKASTDALTGLYNRHKFTELYVSSYSTMLQRDNDLSVLLFDLDHFKKINDTYGHNIGDYVLKQLSNVLLKTLRNIDIVCRWGGEEFVVLLPSANLESAGNVAEKLRRSIEEFEMETVGRVTASVGVTKVIAGETMESVIERADEALYLAKQSGRNCIKTDLDL